MKILHVVPGLNEKWNGIAVAANLIADDQRKDGHEADLVDAKDFGSCSSTSTSNLQPVSSYAEIWVHSMWTWRLVWMACFKVLRCRAAIGVPRLVRMTHANLDPLRYRYHGWKKMLAAPFERWIFSKTDRVVVTGEWEEAWCRQWGLKNEMQVLDLEQYFKIKSKCEVEERADRALHVLYLGRRHPLKGVGFLERAVQEINEKGKVKSEKVRMIDLRIESSLFGEEKEKAWEWADVLCLPTLSENFGLVVAEALEHGRPVITTDGAPAWEPPPEAAEVKVKGQGQQWWDHVFYLRGYREGTDAERVKLLKDALVEFVG